MINVVEADKAVAVEVTGIGPGENSVVFADAARLGKAHLRGPAALHGMVEHPARAQVRHSTAALGRPQVGMADAEPAEQTPAPRTPLDRFHNRLPRLTVSGGARHSHRASPPLATAAAWDLDCGGNQQLTEGAGSCGCCRNRAGGTLSRQL